jgi:hypothetical protein
MIWSDRVDSPTRITSALLCRLSYSGWLPLVHWTGPDITVVWGDDPRNADTRM